jgi:hypothetical protein
VADGTYTVTVTDALSSTATATAQVQIQQISLALLSASNLRYLSAEQAGTEPLIANRTAIGPWEQFYGPRPPPNIF